MSAPSASSASPPSGPPPPPPKPRIRRKRFLLNLLGFALVSTALLSLATWHLWHSRTSYLQQALQRALPQFQSQLGDLDLTRDEIRLSDLALREKDSPKPFASLHSASLSNWKTLLTDRSTFSQISLDGLHLTTSAASLPRLLSLLAPSSKPPTTPSTPTLPRLQIESIHLNDFQFQLEGDATTPHLEFTLNHALTQLHLSPTDPPSLKNATFNLQNLHLRTPDGSTLDLPELTLSLSFIPETGLLHIHSLNTPAPVDLKLLPALGTFLTQLTQPPQPNSPSTPPTPFPSWFKGVVIENTSVPNLTLNAPDGLPSHPAAPPIALQLNAAYDAHDVLWQPGQPVTQLGRHHLTLDSLAVRPLNAKPGHILLPSLTTAARLDHSTHKWHLENLAASNADIHWTPDLESALFPPTPIPQGTPPPPAAPIKLLLSLASLTNARLKIEPTPILPLHLKCDLELHSSDLQLEDNQPLSSQPTRLTLRNVETQIPGTRTAAPTTIASIDAIVRPDILFTTGQIDRLHISKPRLSYHVDLDAYAAEQDSPLAPQPPPPPATPSPPHPVLAKLHFAHLAITEGTVKLFGKWGAEFEAETSFQLTTDPIDSLGTPSSNHTLTIDETRLLATSSSATPLPVARIGRFEIKAKLPHLITQRHLESLTLTGGQVEVGEALTSILDPGTSSSPTPSQPSLPQTPPTSEKPKWSAGLVAIKDLQITLQKIAPGLPPLTFAVQFDAQNTPLEPEGLVENFDDQRIELSSLTIPAPYGSLRPVARLDTIFVHFTLDSLLNQHITKVEILHPTLYVGEPLFWYVDYYRQYAAGEIKSDANTPKMALAATDPATALAAASAAVKDDTPKASWTLDELEVHAGKLVLAPKGVPLPGFHQPFPFSFKTKLETGQFDATFDIPPDNYPFEKLKLELIGMKGTVRFNMPLKDVDNNLTETFWVDQIRWKQLHMEKAHLSVTYDLDGIYGKFGGEAYEGYLEGGFNVYLNDSYTWDGWLATTDIHSTEITEKLTPAYFLLDGKINGTLIAKGDSKELYQADITAVNATSGRFSITALNDMLDKLPAKQGAALTDQITRLGLETLRDFEYDTVDAKARINGREGTGYLKIIGPTGSRNFEINVLDHRWKVDPPPTP